MPGDTSTGRDAPVLDFPASDDESIDSPRGIQPHGILFAVTTGTGRITAVSANAGVFCDAPAHDLLGAPLARVLDAASFAAVGAHAALAPGESARLLQLRLAAAGAMNWRATLHATEGSLLLEAEHATPDGELTAFEHLERFQAAASRLQAGGDCDATCQILVEEIRRLTGYDRVKLYLFAADWSGEVIAEARDAAMPSYLGLHFPAHDMPAESRARYARAAERQIPDIVAPPVPLLTTRPERLDIGAVGLRGVAPCHVAYLRNMGVAATLSISLLRRGRLWAMLACHHRTPRAVPLEVRQACMLLAQLAEARLGLIEEAEAARRGVAVKAVESTLLHEAAEGRDYREALRANAGPLLGLLDATGLVLVSGGTVTELGTAPTGPALQRLLDWLTTRDPDMLVTDHLAGVFPPAAEMPEAAGLLVVPLGGRPRDLLIWFRPEIARTVTWAGDPSTMATIVEGTERLTPRRSFAAWTQTMRGRARPWSPSEIAAAGSLRDTIVEIIVRRALDMERMNTQLKRSNEELEAFAYVASHDLKEPLRQIETFGTLLERAFARGTDPAEKVARWFSGIHTSSRRLRQMIGDLADFSRLGGEARQFAPADLNDLLAAVLRDLETRTEEVGATITAGKLPVVVCDGTQIRQVLQNLIANALKYRHPARAPVITISATRHAAADSPLPLALPAIELRIADNGIGFEERHRERIFEPFERLHSADDYEGSGLGLAICRKVIGHHGGTITASARPGAGAVFTLLLPLRSLPEQKASPAS